jgi:hypothetical protein
MRHPDLFDELLPDPNAERAPGTEMLLYQTDDGGTRVEVRFEGATAWLPQAGMAELFQTTPQNITQHIGSIYREGELTEAATCKTYLHVRQEGTRTVQRNLKHYSLPVILAVGYRVQSHRGTQFRQWATARLEEYLMKGFTLDDQRLKRAGGGNYFDELLERIRDIRSSEKVFWRKVLDIYATSIDYAPQTETSQTFFRTVQNKMHFAAHGHTAAELIAERADASKPNMGLTHFAGAAPRKADISVAKNYLDPEEAGALNKIVTAYLEFAELQATNRRPMYMADWVAKLDGFLKLSERDVLRSGGTITREDAMAKATLEYDRFSAERAQLPPRSPVDEHFDEAVRQISLLEKEHRASEMTGKTAPRDIKK